MIFTKMVKPRFAPLVKAGTKRQTVRPVPKRLPKVGDVFSLRTWAGKPYRSKQVRLKVAKLTEVRRIRILKAQIQIEGRYLTRYELHEFAIADGFAGILDLLTWFNEEHGLPFKGILYKW